jgi:hypothetical protein
MYDDNHYYENRISILERSISSLKKELEELNLSIAEEITNRDYWEEKATEIAHEVGLYFDIEVGDHSSMNCPVQNAFDYVYCERRDRGDTDK